MEDPMKDKLKKKKILRNNAILAIPIICILYSIVYIFDTAKERINSFINYSHITNGEVLKKYIHSSFSRCAGTSTEYHMSIKYYNKSMKKYFTKEILGTKNEYNTYKINDVITLCILEKRNEIMSKEMLERDKEGISMNTSALIVKIILYACIAFFAIIGVISYYCYLNFDKIILTRCKGTVKKHQPPNYN